MERGRSAIGTIGTVAIIGGGFTGTLLAVNLLRHDGPRVALIERRPLAGGGLAFGAAHPGHLLNVRAANMSAFPDDPEHFKRWLSARGMAPDERPFVPRLLYGEYLRDVLDAARRDAGDRLQIVAGEAASVEHRSDAKHIALVGGTSIAANAVTLAIGTLPPHPPPGMGSAVDHSSYVGDPWAAGALDGLADSDTVLVLGTGLTMVDVVLALRATGFGGRIVALSRRGLLPHAHASGGVAVPGLAERPTESGSALVRRIRARATEIGWHSAIDELRPFTQKMWAAAGDAERKRFLRHLRPWWDVHRHRLTPSVAQAIGGLTRLGALELHAGKIVTVAPGSTGVAVTWRPRGDDAARTMTVARVINCTGPQGDLARVEDPLLRSLVECGTIRPDPLRIGIDVDAQSRTLAADGIANRWLYALGPMTRGAFWEIVAVPDIRMQCWSVARRLANAHWVGGEGL